jgi:hypothetical protein
MGRGSARWVHTRTHHQPARRTLRDGSLEDTFPGTSCQATIVRSLRDAALGPNVLDKPIDVVFRRIPGTH